MVVFYAPEADLVLRTEESRGKGKVGEKLRIFREEVHNGV